jgi:hypothetical protein
MIKYVIMSWVLGFSGNKLFGKNKSLDKSAFYGGLALGGFLIVYYGVKLI